ncbi:hypothetical protein D3C85_377550 [compost metagenome]
MFTMPLWPLKYAVPFVAGVALTGLWHAYVMRGVQLEKAEKTTATLEQIKTDTVQNDDNTFLYLEQLNEASKESDRLRASLSDGRVTLRLCLNDKLRADLSAANSEASANAARESERRMGEVVIQLIEKTKRLEAWAESAHRFINGADATVSSRP